MGKLLLTLTAIFGDCTVIISCRQVLSDLWLEFSACHRLKIITAWWVFNDVCEWMY